MKTCATASSGFSLVEMLISLAVMGVLAAVAVAMSDNFFGSTSGGQIKCNTFTTNATCPANACRWNSYQATCEARNIDLDNELESLRTSIRTRLDCPKTRAYNGYFASVEYCPLGYPLRILGKKTNDLVLDWGRPYTPYTKIGRFYVYAQCSGYTLEMSYYWSKSESGPWSSLFPQPLRCNRGL